MPGKTNFARAVNLPAIILAFVCGGLLVTRPTIATGAGSAAAAQAAPASVASIDLTAVFQGLEEMQAVNERLAAMRADRDAELERRRNELQQLKDSLETTPTESPQHRRIQESILFKGSELSTWENVRNELIALEESLEFIRMHRKVVEAASALAESRGIDYILLDDTGIQARPARSPDQTLAQLYSRRMIHANPARDVTGELITRMNNAYAADKTAGPAQEGEE